MFYGEIRLRFKENTACRTKLKNCSPLMKSPILLKVYEYILLPLLTNNLELCDQKLRYIGISQAEYIQYQL